MRYALIIAIFAFQSASAAESYNAGQAGSWLNLCGGGRTAATCMMYLAGYRAGMQDALMESQEISETKRESCENGDGKLPKAVCNLPSEVLASQTLNGCSLQSIRLPANVIHPMLVNYLEAHPEAKSQPFPVVYKKVMAESFPCD